MRPPSLSVAAWRHKDENLGKQPLERTCKPQADVQFVSTEGRMYPAELPCDHTRDHYARDGKMKIALGVAQTCLRACSGPQEIHTRQIWPVACESWAPKAKMPFLHQPVPTRAAASVAQIDLSSKRHKLLRGYRFGEAFTFYSISAVRLTKTRL